MALRRAGLALLTQKRKLLDTIAADHYRSMSPLVGASIGQHLRHSTDHFAKLFNSIETYPAANVLKVAYDVRDRGTAVESDVEIAKKEVDRLEHVLKSLPDEAFDKECRPEFILSAEGDAYTFKSTFGRELGFCVHHAIHHHHSIKVIANSLGYELPPGFGLAPSTANYQSTHKS